jgi:hypothetical protein
MIKAVTSNLPIRRICTTVLMLFANSIRILEEASALQIVDHPGRMKESCHCEERSDEAISSNRA